MQELTISQNGAPSFDSAPATLNTIELERAVKSMYEKVAAEPHADFHFELGRALALRLGYKEELLNRVPSPAVESFAGVGFHLDLPCLRSGERVLDLGSGAGMDSFYAAHLVGSKGRVIGLDMTPGQRKKAAALRDQYDELNHCSFEAGYIEDPPFKAESFDCVISNGVINLVVNKAKVFQEAARVLKPGGRLALSDIVSTSYLPQSVVCDATLWAACIGGAMHREDYLKEISAAGFDIEFVRFNPQYRFITGQADRSASKFGVSSLSVLATKRG